jgi:2,3-dihydroxybiphenyl 1,2-dioxygenase
MDILGLGYVGLNAKDLTDWRDYGPNLLGLQAIDRGGTRLAFRMDDWTQRLLIEQSEGPAAAFYGWEVANAATLDRVAARLEAAGTPVARGSRGLADERFVRDLIVFHDPMGNRVELFHGPDVAREPFRPGRAISGFRTGPLGLGHAVMTVREHQPALDFYQGLLGFRISDYATRPYPITFLHTNERQHSLAFVQAPADGLHHIMIELFSLDDVGQGYDLALQRQSIRDQSGGDRLIATTLGRHTNDYITSYYSWTPSGFMMEYGWGGRTIDPATWQAEELVTGFSLWGHDRLWQTPEHRAAGQRMALDMGRDGVRRPLQVLPGNHAMSIGACPWFDSMRRSALAGD